MNNITIYIAAPYTVGDTAVNVRTAIDLAHYLIDKGFAPYTPHLTHFMHMIHPRSWAEWMHLDIVFLDRCDAIIRIAGHSQGADIEWSHAMRLGKPGIVINPERLADNNALNHWLAELEKTVEPLER